MRIPALLYAALFLLASCNHTSESKPDTDRVIKDTLAQILLRPFNEKPVTENICVRVETKQEEYPCSREAGIKSFLNGMKKEPQHFVINPNQPVEVTAENGTRVSLTPNCFVGADGQQILTPVDLELKECYSEDDMLLENLSSTTDGGVMDSKGALHLSAKAGGQELKLKDGTSIRIQFPFSPDNKDGYQFFYGNEDPEGAVNWIASAENSEVPMATVTDDLFKPEFSFHGLKLIPYLNETIAYPDEAKLNELSAKVGVSFSINEKGEVGEVITAEAYKIFRDEIARVLKNMPAWKPASYQGRNIASLMHLEVDFNLRRSEQVKVDFNETEVSLGKDGNNFYLENGRVENTPSGGNRCIKSVNQLGWISYARINRSKKEKADVAVCADPKSDVRLILKHRKSIIRGQNCLGYAHFKNIPLGAEAYVLAVRYDKGNVFYAYQPVVLKKQTVVSLTWRKGDEAEIKKLYRQFTS